MTEIDPMTHLFSLRFEPLVYSETAPLVSGTGASRVQAGADRMSNFLPHHQASKLRVLVRSVAWRYSGALEMHCIAGLSLPDRALDEFHAMFPPNRMSHSALDALQREITAAMEDAELPRRLAEPGLEPETTTSETLGRNPGAGHQAAPHCRQRLQGRLTDGVRN
jgi:tripartite-type tricarboxylate transporter receptor subunit TctC